MKLLTAILMFFLYAAFSSFAVPVTASVPGHGIACPEKVLCDKPANQATAGYGIICPANGFSSVHLQQKQVSSVWGSGNGYIQAGGVDFYHSRRPAPGAALAAAGMGSGMLPPVVPLFIRHRQLLI